MSPSVGRWIISLVMISILGVAVDLILPSGSMKKYVRFLIGISILSAILKPIFIALDQLPNLEKYTAQAFATMDIADLGTKVKWLEGQQQRDILDYFARTMESNMEQQIKQFKGYRQVKVNVEMDSRIYQGAQLPDILKVYVDIGTSADSTIKPVRIDIGAKEDGALQADKPDQASKEQQEIKALLSGIYGIDQARIEVRFRDDLGGGLKNDKQKDREGELP